MPTLDFLRASAMSRSKPAAKSRRFRRAAGNQIGVDVDAGFCTEEMEIVGELVVILPAADERGDFGIEGLDADLELQRAGRNRAMTSRQGIPAAGRNHLEMEEMPGSAARQKEFEDGLAGWRR